MAASCVLRVTNPHRATRNSRIRDTTMKTKVLMAAAVLLNAASLLATPRVMFVRALPATYDLKPAEQLAFIYAIGDSEQVNVFVVDFVDAAGRAGTYRIENAVENNRHLVA